MCYSIESSLRTTGMSLFAIIYLLNSGIPKFQYLGAVLIGWCAMQFAEALLWMTDPQKCTTANRLLTLLFIPFVLALQPLGCVWGSLFFNSWNENKNFIISYTIFIVILIFFQRHILNPMIFKYKDCTTITAKGHLDWSTDVQMNNKHNWYFIISMFVWVVAVGYPLFKFWKGNRLWPFYVITLIGIFIGIKSDSPGSIWCYITSYASISSVILLFLHNRGIKIID